MKKYLVIFVIALFAGTGSRADAQSADSKPLLSFRGVLYGILEDVKEDVQNIASAVRNPFSSNATAPSVTGQVSGENNLSFAVMGDTQNFSIGNPKGNFQTVVGDIAKDNVDLVFSTGDLTGSCESYTECLKKHTDWKNIDASLLSKTYAAMGNHDNIGDKGGKAWQDAFNFPTNGPSGYSELTYSFNFKNSHFVVLDSDSSDLHEINSEQRTWLEKDLAANKKDNTFVFFHEPAFPVSSKVGESLDKNPEERNALWQIFDKHNVTGVFNGHEHIVSRRKIGNIYQFVFGSTDSFDHDLPDPGVAEYANQGQGRFGIVSVNGKEITVKTYSPDNQELDFFTFLK
jgi:3',5'-cyclic-AMP phosphodiesterase